MSQRFGLLKRARRRFRDLDYPAACEILETEFFENDPIAHFILGEIYTYANKRETGLKADHRRALKHYKKSSDLGYNKASYEVGDCYQLGDGVKQNYNKTVEYWLTAIAQGHVIAQYYLADLYIDHFPDKIDDAIELLKRVINDGEYEDLAYASWVNCICVAKVSNRIT